MADRDIRIGIETTGAAKAAEEVRKVEDAVEDLAAAQRAAAATAGSQGGSFGGQLSPKNSLPTRETQAANEAAARSFADLTDKVRVNEFAFYDLNAEISRTGNTITTVAAGPIKTLGAKVAAGTAPIKNLGNVATQVGYQVTDFVTQVQMGTSAFTAFSQQAPQAIGAIQQMGGAMGSFKEIANASVGAMLPLSLIVTELAIGIPMVVRAYKEMTAAQDALTASAKNFTDQLRFQEDQQRKLNLLVRQDFVASVYQKEADDLERQVKALGRINEIRAAQGSTETAQAAAAVTTARNTGGDVAGAQGNAIAVSVANQLDALDSAFSQVLATAAAAQLAAETAAAARNEAALENDPFSDKFKALEVAADKALNLATEAQLDLDAERQKYDLAKAEIIATSSAELSTLQTESQAAVTNAARTAAEAIQARANEAGAELSANAKFALDGLLAVLADGVVKPDEMARLTQAMQQIQASREGADRSILAGLEGLQKTTATVLVALPAIVGRITALENAARQLAADVTK